MRSSATRLAWRELATHRGRSALIGILIALPVLLASATSVWFATAGATPDAALAHHFGPQSWRVDLPPGATQDQAAALTAAAGQGGGLTEQIGVVDGEVHQVAVSIGLVTADASDPGFAGRWLVSGDPSQVLLTADLSRELGVSRGDVVEFNGTRHEVGGTFAVVGMAWPGMAGAVVAPGHPLAQAGASTWFPADPLTDADVQRLEEAGLEVLSADAMAGIAVRNTDAGTQTAIGAVLAGLGSLVVAAVAAAAFTISIRSQQQQLALLSATGAAPRVLLRVLVRSGVFLGLVSVVAGTVLGVGAGALASWLQHLRDPQPGFTVVLRWDALVLFALMGLASAWVAVWVPAKAVADKDVLTALAEAQSPPSAPPAPRWAVVPLLLGAVVIGAGVWQARVQGEFPDVGRTILVALAAGAVATVGWFVAAVWAVPWLVDRLAATVAGRSLAWRLALRDASRSGGRAVALVTASASAVAIGALALTYVTAAGNQEVRDYRMSEPLGITQLRLDPFEPDAGFTGGLRRTAMVAHILGVPSAQLEAWGPRPSLGDDGIPNWFADPIMPEDPSSWSPRGIIVGGGDVLEFLTGQPATPSQAEALAAGAVLVFDREYIAQDRTLLTVMDFSGGEVESTTHELEALWAGEHPGMYVLVPPEAAAGLGMEVTPQAVWLRHAEAPDRAAVRRAADAVFGMGGEYRLLHEGGPHSPALDLRPGLLVGFLATALAVAAVAMVLAVGEGRGAQATLATVGATRGLLRRAAAAQAMVCVALGGLVGAVVGSVPVAVVLASSAIGMGPVPLVELAILALCPALLVGVVAVVAVRPEAAQLVRAA